MNAYQRQVVAMKTMKRLTVVNSLAVVILLVMIGPIWADEPLQRVAGVVDRFIDEQTVVVVHVDMRHFEPRQLLQHFDLPGLDQRLIRRQTEDFRQVQRQLRDAGCDHLFLMMHLGEMNLGWSGLGVVREGGNASRVATELVKIPWFGKTQGRAQTRVVGRVICVGHLLSVQRLQRLANAQRPEFVTAMKAAGPGQVHVAMLLSNDHRRALAAMLPNLPAELGGGSGADVARGLQWATMALQLDPDLQLSATIKSGDPGSAKSVLRLLDVIKQQLAANEVIRLRVPRIEDVVTLFEFAVEQDEINLQLDSDEMARLKQLMGPLAIQLAAHSQASNHLRQLVIAMHNYFDVHQRFPARAILDGNGKPLLSWRVELLPFLGHQRLYDLIRKDEPWDSEYNRKFIRQMPEVFGYGTEAAGESKTAYQVFANAESPFGGEQGISIRDIKDGTSKTIAIAQVPAGREVVWTRPQDITMVDARADQDLFADKKIPLVVGFCDGTVGVLPTTLTHAQLRGLMTINGQEIVDW